MMIPDRIDVAERGGAARGDAHSGGRPARILYFAPHTIGTSAGSGIQRVTRQVAPALRSLAPLDFVKWDPVDGQLRYFNAPDHDRFFQSRLWRQKYQVNRYAERRGYRFEDTIAPAERSGTWLMLPEIAHHMPNGLQIYRDVLTEARERKLRTAALLYDLIPITNAAYQGELKSDHERYIRQLLEIDLLLPISFHSANELARYEARWLREELRRHPGRAVAPVPLAGTSGGNTRARTVRTSLPERNLILLLGTVEPRKRQVEVLRAFKALGLGAKYGLKALVIGALHPQSAEAFRRIIADDPAIEYLGYVEETRVEALFARARFSVFASNDEGFGLPICESLANGVPCLAANFGAMREAAEGGGCLLLDVNDANELGRGLERLARDDGLIEDLRREIGARTFRTWDDYARDVLRLMSEYQETHTGRRGSGAPAAP